MSDDSTRPRPRPRPRPTPAPQSPPATEAAPELRPLLIPAIVAAIVLVALVVLDLVLFNHYRDNKDQQDATGNHNAVTVTYSDAIGAAKKRVPALFTYKYTTIDADVATAISGLTGSFKTDYKKVMTQQVEPSARTLKVVTTATQMGVSVIDGSTDARSVSVLVFLDQQTTRGSGSPSIQGRRVQVTMKKVGQDWLISNLTPI